MKTLFVLVDALKSLYLSKDYMPFLFSLSQKGFYIKEIIPCPGFCERSEIFSGLDCFDTGNFAAIGYIPEISPYKNDGLILCLASLADYINSRVTRRLFSIWRKRNGRILNAYRIPFPTLKKIALTEDGYKQLIPHSDIFDVLNKSGLSYTLEGFTSLANLKRKTISVLDFAKKEISKQTDFVPLYIGVLDVVGHKYGDDIDSIKPYLKEVDSQLKSLYEEAKKGDYAFCILGDHGMVSVRKKVDVRKVVQETGCRLYQDYEAFYDSTMVRFWFYSDEAKQIVRESLDRVLSDVGFTVDKGNCLKYRIPLDVLNSRGIPVYGDLVWCANPGILITPDYYHSTKSSVSGMHGYVETEEGHGTGLFVKIHKGIHHEIVGISHLYSVCGLLCNLLGIHEPNKKDFKRVLY